MRQHPRPCGTNLAVILVFIMLFAFIWYKSTELNTGRYPADLFSVEEDLTETHKLFINGTSGLNLIHAVYYRDASHLFASAGGHYYYIALDQAGQLKKGLKLKPLDWNLHNSFFYPGDASLYLVLNLHQDFPDYKGISLVFVPIDNTSKDLVMDSAVEFPGFQDHVEQNEVKDNTLYVSGFSFVAKFREHDNTIIADYYSTLSKIPLDIEITATSVDAQENIYFIARFSGIYEEDRKTPYLQGYWFGKIDYNKEFRFLRKIPDISISVPPPDKIACVKDTLYLIGSRSVFILNKDGESKKTLTFPNHLTFSKSLTIDETFYLYGSYEVENNSSALIVAKLLEDNVIVNPGYLSLSEISFFPSYLSQEGNLVYAYGLSDDINIGISNLTLTGKEKSIDLFKRLAIQDRETSKLKGKKSQNEISYNEVDLFKLNLVSKDTLQASKLQRELFKGSDAAGLILIDTR